MGRSREDEDGRRGQLGEEAGGAREEGGDGASRTRFRAWFSLLGGLVVGAALMFHTQLGSGLHLMQPDPIDARFQGYLLEHGFRWLAGDPAHRELWSPAIFFPEKNAAGLADPTFALELFFAPHRAAGLAPDTAWQGMSFLLATASFFGFAWLAVTRLGVGPIEAALGGILFAFGSVRAVRLGHQQLAGGVFLVLAAAALWDAFRRDASAEWRAPRAILGFWVSWALLFYSGFHCGWLAGLGFGLLGVSAVAWPGGRRALWRSLRCEAGVWAVGAMIFACALAPMGWHYLGGLRTGGPQPFETVATMLPRPQSWLYLGPGSWLYGWLAELGPMRGLAPEMEHRIGVGLATSALISWGAWTALRRREAAVVLMLAASLLLVLIATRWPGGFTFWGVVYLAVPGGKAIRAVSRIAVVLLLPASLCFSIAWRELLRSRRSGAMLVALAALCIAEQGQTMPAFSKSETRRRVAAMVARIPPGCAAFYYSAEAGFPEADLAQVDAMWVSLESGVPTVNGYGGRVPVEWAALGLGNRAPHPARATRAALRKWLQTHGRDGSACWLRGGIGGSEPIVEFVDAVRGGLG